MGKILGNEYPASEPMLTADQIRAAVTGDFDGFKYFFENCMVLQDRDTRQIVHPKMNKGQEMIARTILGYVDKRTRATVHKECVILGPRQFGKSTLLTAVANYIEAYVPGMENLNCVHTLQTGTTATKFFKQKIEPIVAGVHPMLFPTITRDTLGTSTLLQYKDILIKLCLTVFQLFSPNCFYLFVHKNRPDVCLVSDIYYRNFNIKNIKTSKVYHLPGKMQVQNRSIFCYNQHTPLHIKEIYCYD